MTKAVARTHPGRRRTANEDSFLIDPDLQLFAIADGMGGHRAGEVASKIGIETVAEFVRSSSSDSGITWPYGLNATMSFEANQLQNAIQLANLKVLAAARNHPDRQGMGSTLVAACVRAGRLVYAWVGDSRLYLFRAGALRQLSTDDSWAASMIRSGARPEVVKSHPMRHLLTSALGTDDRLRISPGSEALDDGDMLLLCTDGLHGSVSDDAMAAILADRNGSLDRTADRLIDAANDAGGPDNVTVILVQHRAESALGNT
jgi:PPM family protein phosphatase